MKHNRFIIFKIRNDMFQAIIFWLISIAIAMGIGGCATLDGTAVQFKSNSISVGVVDGRVSVETPNLSVVKEVQ